MKKYTEKYFLAANSAEGFVSAFKENYDPHLGFKAYIIKGGPGTGKSSFMRKLAKKAEEAGLSLLLCPCSSDPDSLDGVIIPEKRLFFADGTAPHTLDPEYPAVCEQILNLGDFWKSEGFRGNEKEIMSLCDQNRKLHKSASAKICAAGVFLRDNFNTALDATDKEKVAAFAKKLCRKHIPLGKGGGKEWVRFLISPSPKGLVFLGDWLEGLNTLIPVRDEYGAAATLIFKEIRAFALAEGHEIITLKNGLLPSFILDGILIPSLSLAFIRESSFTPIKADSRRINSTRFYDDSFFVQRKSRPNLKFAKGLLSAATATLREAKAVHDRLEGYYIKNMDFKRLESFADNLCQRLF